MYIRHAQGHQTGGGGGWMPVRHPDFEKIHFFIAHICYYAQVISIGGGGGGVGEVDLTI